MFLNIVFYIMVEIYKSEIQIANHKHYYKYNIFSAYACKSDNCLDDDSIRLNCHRSTSIYRPECLSTGNQVDQAASAAPTFLMNHQW